MTRNNFTKDTQRKAFERSKVDGIPTCECHRLAVAGVPGFSSEGCGRPLGIGNTFYEHIDPDALSKDNSLENAAALVKTCWRKKTDTYDLPTIAKVERVADLAAGIKDPWKQKLPGGRGSYLKKKMNGQVVVRATGERAQERQMPAGIWIFIGGLGVGWLIGAAMTMQLVAGG